jgi:hypothetical protein
MKIRVRFNFVRAGRLNFSRDMSDLFGARNEGFTFDCPTATTDRAALADWNAAQLPGNRLNPFYLTITEEK